MNRDLKNEILKLEQAVKVLVGSKTDMSKTSLFKILVKLRVRYGFNVFGKMPFACAYGVINEKTNHLICFAEKGKHLLYSKDVFADDSAIRSMSGNHLCYIERNKYGEMMCSYMIKSITRINFDYLSYYDITQALHWFESLDESIIENSLLRKEKLQKISEL